jgi:hypothetical protein
VARPHVEPAHAPEIAPESLAGWPDGTTVRVLSRDSETGAITGVVHLPAGVVREPTGLAAECDTYLLSGTLRVGGQERGAGYYEYAPAGSRHERWAALEGCELFLMARDGPPEPRSAEARDPAHLSVDTDALEWAITPIPGMPGGIFLKVMRTVPATGESVFLMGLVPRWSLDKLEYHDMDEECFIIDGDVWIGNCGRLGPGSYFCRPGYTTHGPFFTRHGFVALQWTSTHVVNHFTDDPLSTREENRRAAASVPPPEDHLTELAVQHG